MAFVRSSKITNAKGRSNYLTDPARQEEILCKSKPVQWDEYIIYERTHQKSNAKNNEAREEIISLPNKWAEIHYSDLYQMSDHIAKKCIQKDTDYQFAVHWNKARTNLHIHVLYSERVKTGETKYYDRDVYHTKDGKVARNKKERATDEAGNILPPVHRKGEVANSGFSVKDKKYKTTWWHSEKQDRVNDVLENMGYRQRRRQDYELKQYHQGKGNDAPFIAAKNRIIRRMNDILRDEKNGRNEFELIEMKSTLLADVNAINPRVVKFNVGGYIQPLPGVDDDLILDMIEIHNILLENEQGLEKQTKIEKREPQNEPVRGENRNRGAGVGMFDEINSYADEERARRNTPAYYVPARRTETPEWETSHDQDDDYER